MKSSIVPIIAFLPVAASKGIKVSRRTRSTQPKVQQQQDQRDLYTSETIDLEEAQCCTGTAPTELEVEVDYGDDDTQGTNQTLSPTELVAPRPTYKPTSIETPEPTDIVTPAPTDIVTPAPTEIETPSPTPFQDDGGLTDDTYITTPPPTYHPTGKPNTYHPTDDTDDWGAGWMPTAPSSDDSPLIDTDDDTDDWHGGYPIHKTLDSKAGKGGKSSKGGKSTKNYVTDDAYRGYGLSRVSSLVNSEVSAGYTTNCRENLSLVGAIVGMAVYMYL